MNNNIASSGNESNEERSGVRCVAVTAEEEKRMRAAVAMLVAAAGCAVAAAKDFEVSRSTRL